MLDLTIKDTYPLLEIEIIQLSNLFGNDPYDHGAKLSQIPSTEALDPESINHLNSLDIYQFPEDRRQEVFITSAFRAFFNRDPNKDELKSHLNLLSSSGGNYGSIISSLKKQRDEYINQHNENRDKSIKLTIKNIDRWSATKKTWRWK